MNVSVFTSDTVSLKVNFIKKKQMNITTFCVYLPSVLRDNICECTIFNL
jgi:hypothetical protein